MMVRLNGGSSFLIPFFAKPFANGSNECLKITNDTLVFVVKLYNYFLSLNTVTNCIALHCTVLRDCLK